MGFSDCLGWRIHGYPRLAGNRANQHHQRTLQFEALERRELLDAAGPIPFAGLLQTYDTSNAIIYLGSLVYVGRHGHFPDTHGRYDSRIDESGDTDQIILDLEAGQTVRFYSYPGHLADKELQLHLELLGPDGGLLATASAAAPGEAARLPVVPVTEAGTYTLVVSDLGEAAGNYEVYVALNLVYQAEENNSLDTAQDLDPGFTDLGVGGASRIAVSRLASGTEEDWYRFTLQDGQLASLYTGRQYDQLEIYSPDGTLLATGGDLENGTAWGGDFVASSGSGTYFVRLVCSGRYTLLITRDGHLRSSLTGDAPHRYTATTLSYLDHHAAQPVVEEHVVFGDAAADFGGAVAIDGDYALVAAKYEGNPDRTDGVDSGAVYVYRRDDSGWQEVGTLGPDGATDYGAFGWDVDLDDDTAVVTTSGGVLFIYQLNQESWNLVDTWSPGLGSLHPESADVAICDGTIAVAFKYVHVLEPVAGTWQPVATLGSRGTPVAVDISGDTLVVGRSRYNGDSGGVEVYENSAEGWQCVERWYNTDYYNEDDVGTSVAVFGDLMVKGSTYKRNTSPSGPEGDPPEVPTTGRLYGMQRNPRTGSWEAAMGYITTTASLALESGLLVVGGDARASVNQYDGEYGGRWHPITSLSYQEELPDGAPRHPSVALSDGTIMRGMGGGGEVRWYAVEPPHHDYLVDATAGEQIAVAVAVPGAGEGEFHNVLTPIVELYNPYGNFVASAEAQVGDPGHVSLMHTPSLSGEFTVRVVAGGFSWGEYAVNIESTPWEIPDTAIDLGTVDYRQLDGVAVADEPVWYELQSAHDGLLTVAAQSSPPVDDFELALLLDAVGNVLATAEPAIWTAMMDPRPPQVWQYHWRLDHPVVAGQTYFVRLTGSGAEVDLRLCNLLNRDGTAVTVHGTEGDDTFGFVASSGRRVVINGIVYGAAPEEDVSVTFDAGLGNDVVYLHGSPGDDTLTVSPGSVTASGPNYTLDGSGFEILHAYGTSGGRDVAFMHDSPGRDNLKATPTYTKLYGNGFLHRVKHFDVVHAYSTAGGNDYARLYDSAKKDKFKSTSTYAIMYGSGFYNRAKHFETVVAYATAGGNDLARLFDSPGNDMFIGTPTKARMYNAGSFDVTARLFEQMVAYSTAGGYDRARLFDSPGNDTIRARSTKSVLWSGDYDDPDYKIIVRWFDQVRASAVYGGYDVAKLHGTLGDDHFEATPDRATLSRKLADGSLDLLYEMLAFERVRGYGLEGGNDTAILHDTPGDDHLEAKYLDDGSPYAALWRNDGALGILYDVIAFDLVEAHRSTGNDTTDIAPNVDFLMLVGDWLP